MIDSAQRINGLVSGLPDWLAEVLADEDPAHYADLAEADALLLGSNFRAAHQIRGFDANMPGVRITDNIRCIGG